MKNRVVMDLRVGEQVSINGGLATVKVLEKTGRNRARLVFEVDSDVRLQKQGQGQQAKPEPSS